jgi:hypothetical protein
VPMTKTKRGRSGAKLPWNASQLEPRCHPKAAVHVHYEKLSGHLMIECAKCHLEVMRIIL